MNTLSKFIGGAGILAILSIPFIFATKDMKPVVNVNTPEGKVMNVGGSQPDIVSPYFSVNGVSQFKNTFALADNTSSTLCSIQSPSAASTLIASSVRISGGNTNASAIKVYKGATVTATTTQLYAASVGAGAQATIMATTTTDDFVIEPSSYIVVDTTANFAQTGFCQATFETI